MTNKTLGRLILAAIILAGAYVLAGCTAVEWRRAWYYATQPDPTGYAVAPGAVQSIPK